MAALIAIRREALFAGSSTSGLPAGVRRKGGLRGRVAKASDNAQRNRPPYALTATHGLTFKHSRSIVEALSRKAYLFSSSLWGTNRTTTQRDQTS